jgi:phage terminase large subunit
MSSVNGVGNVFHRRREAGEEWAPGQPVTTKSTNVFVMDWSDHPAKDQAWYDNRRKKAVDDGLLHVFAQEVDRDYSASVVGVIIKPEWVRSAIDAHLTLGFEAKGMPTAGLDVADEDKDGTNDKNALALALGVVLIVCVAWGERDTGRTTRRAIDACSTFGPMSLQYDSIGVGAGVKAEANRLAEEQNSEGKPLLPRGLRLIPWNAGAKVLMPDQRVIEGDRDSPLNDDFYTNLKAQAWWQLRRRFEKTHRAITEGIIFPTDELISLSSKMPGLRQLQKELSQATASKGARMKLLIDKSPEGTRSPNMADAVVMAYWPADQGAYDASLGWVG